MPFAGWEYESALFSIDLVDIGSLGAAVPAWFHIEAARAESRSPSPQQVRAWEEFCTLLPEAVTAALRSHLADTGVVAGDIVPQHVVVPQQDRTPLRLVSLHLDVDGADPRSYEGIFADGRLVHLGEDTGLWAREEWPEFNDPRMTADDWRRL